MTNDVRETILRTLPKDALWDIADECDADISPDATAEELRQILLVDASIETHRLLSVVPASKDELQRISRKLGLPTSGTNAELTRAIARAARRADGPASSATNVHRPLPSTRALEDSGDDSGDLADSPLRGDAPEVAFRAAALAFAERLGERVDRHAPIGVLEYLMAMLGFSSRAQVIAACGDPRVATDVPAPIKSPNSRVELGGSAARESERQAVRTVSFDTPAIGARPTREQALGLLRPMIGHDLRVLAGRHGVGVFVDGRLDKGWAGKALERAIGLPSSSSRHPDGGDWELKAPAVRHVDGFIVPKGTMKITMIDPADVIVTPFRSSWLYRKIRRMLVCPRLFLDDRESRAPLVDVIPFDLDEELTAVVEQDYEEVRDALRARRQVSSSMGALVQPRTAGAGHGSQSRAFYARRGFVARILREAR